jgi:DNA-binding transcriptional regulator YiaG
MNFVRKGGSKSEAARLFGVSRSTVFAWVAGETGGISLIQQAGLEDARKALRLTQAAMAASLGISVRQWEYFESGTKTAPAYVLMNVSLLLATSESPGREIVKRLVSQTLTATSCGSG